MVLIGVIIPKMRLFNRRAQTSVEYLLMIGVVTTMVFSLLGFSGYLDTKMSTWKVAATKQLGGDYKLSKSDFMPIGGSTSGSKGGGRGGAGGGKGKGGAGSAGGGGGTSGGGGEAPGVTPPPSGVPSATEEENVASKKSRAKEMGTNETATQRQQGESYDAIVAGEGAGGAAGSKAGGAGEEGLTGDEKNDDESIIKKGRLGEGATKEKTLAQRDWSIGKFLIILVVLIFIIIFVLKARQARD